MFDMLKVLQLRLEKAEAQRKKDQADTREQTRKLMEELEYKIKRLEQQATWSGNKRTWLRSNILKVLSVILAVGVSPSLLFLLFL